MKELTLMNTYHQNQGRPKPCVKVMDTLDKKMEFETTKGAVVNLESTYYNVVAPASYGGLSKFKLKGYTKKEVREWLQSQDTYTLHKPTRRRFTRRRVVVYGIDHQWQADLVDLAKLSSYNKGFKYCLTCIDVLSRYAWVVPLKDKTGKTLKEAFQVIFKSGRHRTWQT